MWEKGRAFPPSCPAYIRCRPPPLDGYDGGVAEIDEDGRSGPCAPRTLHPASGPDRYRLLFESVAEGLCVIEMFRDEGARAPPDGLIIEVNGAFERQTGLAAAAGRSLRELALGEEWLETLAQVARTGDPVRFEKRAAALGRTLDVYAFRVGGPGSRAVAAAVRDVTARHQAEEELREAKARLSYVLDGSSHGFWDWNLASGRVQFSESWAAILGYHLEELAPHIETWRSLVHPDDLPAVTAAAQASARADPAQYADEYRLRHKDGRWVWVYVRGKVVERDRKGNAVRAAGTCIDVTARRRADESLRAALADNEKLVAELRDALDNVKVLSGFLPICMHCKKIRDDRGYWERMEEYISAHTDALFSHGLCPECLRTHYSEVTDPAERPPVPAGPPRLPTEDPP